MTTALWATMRASDFLWGKVEGVEPTTNVIRLPLLPTAWLMPALLLSKVPVSRRGEWVGLEKQVLVTNTIQDTVINLADGTVTPTGDVSPNSIIEQNVATNGAIVVPQTVPAGTTMFSITLGGIPYKFSKNEERFVYVSGKMNNFGIRVDKRNLRVTTP